MLHLPCGDTTSSSNWETVACNRQSHSRSYAHATGSSPSAPATNDQSTSHDVSTQRASVVYSWSDTVAGCQATAWALLGDHGVAKHAGVSVDGRLVWAAVVVREGSGSASRRYTLQRLVTAARRGAPAAHAASLTGCQGVCRSFTARAQYFHWLPYWPAAVLDNCWFLHHAITDLCNNHILA